MIKGILNFVLSKNQNKHTSLLDFNHFKFVDTVTCTTQTSSACTYYTVFEIILVQNQIYMPEKCTQMFLNEKNVPQVSKNGLRVQQYFKVIVTLIMVGVTANGKKLSEINTEQ